MRVAENKLKEAVAAAEAHAATKAAAAKAVHLAEKEAKVAADIAKVFMSIIHGRW